MDRDGNTRLAIPPFQPWYQPAADASACMVPWYAADSLCGNFGDGQPLGPRPPPLGARAFIGPWYADAKKYRMNSSRGDVTGGMFRRRTSPSHGFTHGTRAGGRRRRAEINKRMKRYTPLRALRVYACGPGTSAANAEPAVTFVLTIWLWPMAGFPRKCYYGTMRLTIIFFYYLDTTIIIIIHMLLSLFRSINY